MRQEKPMEMTDIKEFNLAAIDVGSNAARLLIKTISMAQSIVFGSKRA